MYKVPLTPLPGNVETMRKLLLLILLLSGGIANSQTISTAKPWTYWWWMGSAVNKADITVQLEQFAKAGLGGVHIIPIYGVKGDESQNISFLGDKWLDVMQHTVREGKRLGLGVDMTTGTGWPFGGPNVSQEMGARQMSVKDGHVNVQPTGQQVKRAAPGGVGLVVDPFRKDGMTNYLSRFDSAFAKTADRPRSMYMDSYEAYGANWTNDFVVEFKKRRGYDITPNLSFLADSSGSSEAELIKIDYHQTLAELLRERYAHEWTKWSKGKGFLTRYQAHGSPGNLLDLYDEADIPETESFGTSRFNIPGLRIDPDYSINQFGTPNPLAMKFASSAANFSGKKLVSSETGTWLANHFKVSLSQVKPQVDELFTAGINHIFYHGTTYSPPKEVYPGWLFYASTNFGASSHFAIHLSLLNKYVERCQTLLQNSKPDNDVLVYFPIHDLWSTQAKSAGGVHLLEVHHVDRWLLDLPFGALTQKLLKNGYSFDYVSDSQLSRLTLDENGDLTSGFTVYKTLLIPATTYIPEQTLIELQRLASAGARIVFDKKLPEQVTGFNNHADRQITFLKKLTELKSLSSVQVGNNLDQMLLSTGVVQEEIAKKGLSFIRKKDENGSIIYFVTNLGDSFKEDYVSLAKIKTAGKYDPLVGESLLRHRFANNREEILLALSPGQSCFLHGNSDGADVFSNSREKEFGIKGIWALEFLKGMPSMPRKTKMTELKSWTELPDSAVYFSGTVRYKIRFDLPSQIAKNEFLKINLGDVREVAQVKLNGKAIDTLWSIPFETFLPLNLLKTKNNVLEIEVTNLSANYMRLRDKQLPEWKKFNDINIVDITYKKFDASNWLPMPSGLLGPIRLIYR